MGPCTRCGTPVPSGAKFCMNCGQPAPVTAPAAGSSVPMAWPQTKSNAGVWWAIGSVLVIAAVVFGLGAVGILRLRGADKSGPMLVQTGPEQGKILARKAEDPPPVLQRHQDDPIRMPDDVRAWLEHLERIERAKQELQRDQMDDLMISMRSIDQLVAGFATEGLMDPDAPDNPTAGVNDFLPIEKMTADWKELRRKFNQEGPPCPEECKPLRDEYDTALAQVPGVLSDINAIAGDLFDPAKKEKIKDLREVQKSHRDYIDKPLTKSDRLVGEICDRYDTKKWFDIKVDSGGIMGMPGF
ncbi:MAG: zinc ribbon domain-containing protein [Fimbriimonadaceae bacterium]|nr:zinc ribbon domain-containing protein [Fimbriimonadaceae bacterium]